MIQNNLSFKLPVFLILIILVILLQVILLKPIVGQGLTHEDYAGFYSIGVFKNLIFSDPVGAWNQIGTHNVSHEFFIAFLDLLFGENYTFILYAGIFLKIISTILLYPLILVVTKNKLLAFLTTLFYAISYSSAGALSLYVVGNEYLGASLLILFLITYYRSFESHKYWLILLSSLFLVLTYLASPIRIFPIFAAIFITELFIIMKFLKDKRGQFFIPLIRSIVIFAPILLILLFSTKSTGTESYALAGLTDFLNIIKTGNWFLILNPLWGFGYLFFPPPNQTFLRIFGQLDISNFFSYYLSFFHLLLIFLGIFIAFFSSNKPKKFFVIFIIINLAMESVTFLMLTRHLNIPSESVSEYNPFVFILGQYAGLVANFIISVALTFAAEWLMEGKKNTLLLLILASPFVSLLFIFGQWIFTRQYFMYQEGLHRYLVIPAIFSSIFLASIITVTFRKNHLTSWAIVILVLIFAYSFFNSMSEISRGFNIKKTAGADLKKQEMMKAKVLKNIPFSRVKNNLLFYIKLSIDSNTSTPAEDTLDWRNLIYWMHIRRSHLTDGKMEGCVAITWDENELNKMAAFRDNFSGFLFNDEAGSREAACLGQDKFFYLEDFYAYTINQGELKNITKEVKDKILFTPIR